MSAEQPDLFGAVPAQRLEVHEHSFIEGPRSRYGGRPEGCLVHSHPGGDQPHQHPQTGPASYTIDQDDWARTTGLRGGGRKEFTDKPTGEQLPLIELAEWQKSFDVVVLAPKAATDLYGPHRGAGPGIALPARMALAFGMKFRVVDGGRS